MNKRGKKDVRTLFVPDFLVYAILQWSVWLIFCGEKEW